MKKYLQTFLVGALALAGGGTLRATYYDDIGYTRLVAELQASGSTVPNGSNVTVTQVEAPLTATGTVYPYLPDSSQFTGVTITNQSASAYTGTVSWHATMVGNAIYGDNSMGSGVTSVSVYNANDWLFTGKLYFNTSGSAPKVETSDVVNHSWVYSFINQYGTAAGTTYDKAVLNRFDYQIQRDDFVAVVGINNNDSGTDIAQNLLASAYNVISVGRSDGVHVSGTSTTVNTGVTFPHVVVSAATTSEATAVVSGASVFLISSARSSGTSVSTNGDKSEVIKALVLAGATKDQFPTWSNSSTHPLDATYGAGQLNVYNSYHILMSGEQAVSASSSALVANTGWDFNTISLSTAKTISYYLNLTSGGSFSIALTWNALYSGSNYDSLTLNLANLDLYLYTVNSGTLGSLVASSVTTSDNVEYIWSSSLAAGNYVIQVKNATGSGSIDYALAWQNNGAVPEPGAMALIALGLGVVAVGAYRRRRAR